MASEVLSARRVQTRDKLVDAALRVFADKGVGGASVEEICEAAGFTRGAFYSNFESKDALCVAVVERQCQDALAASREAIASLPEGDVTDLPQLAEQAIRVFLRAQRRDRTSLLAALELRLYAAREESIRATYRQLDEAATRMFGEVVEQTANSLGYELTVGAEEAVRVLHAVYEHGATYGLIAGDPPEADRRATQLASVLRSMLRPRT